MEVLLVVCDVVAIVLAIGTLFYAYRTASTFKGGVIEKGMRIISFSPIFLILSILAEVLSESGYEGLDEIHDALLVVFILFAFIGFRAVVQTWRKIGEAIESN